MQTENDTSKPEDSPKQEAGEGCSGATCSPSFVWKAGFHSPPHLHFCRSAQSSHAMCGMPMNTDVTHNNPKKEECCEKCWHYYAYASCVGNDGIAANRPNGLRAIAEGLMSDPNIHVAYHAMMHAASKMDQLDVERDDARELAEQWKSYALSRSEPRPANYFPWENS